MNARAALSASPEQAGRFVCVVGPSGAGKDTLLDIAREALSADGRVSFVRRFITRPPGEGEDHLPVSEADFDAMDRSNAFALSWRAHGLSYGVPAEVVDRCARGDIVVCNLSRAAIADARLLFPTSVVLVTAPSEVLALRIAARGRESAAEALARLQRKVEDPAEGAYDLVIDNVAAPETGAATLVAFLRELRAGVRRPA